MPRLAYFDCFSGISGDMIIGALLDAGLHLDDLNFGLKQLNLPKFEIRADKVLKQNVSATQFSLNIADQKKHRSLSDLHKIVEDADLDHDIKDKAMKIFLRIAEAEAKIHNQLLEKVHFHEIGAVDTIVDVVGALLALRQLGVERVYASRLNVGSGFVDFSHGKFPVPAPATAEILKGIPIYATDSNAELVTPTGAAIIASLAEQFGDLPEMKTEQIGYGAGTQDLQTPNVVRVFIGELALPTKNETDTISVIEANIDDMNPQLYDNVMNKLFELGALDVYLTNISMKKNRPGIKLTVLLRPESESKMTRCVLEETTSLGIRIRRERRVILQRDIEAVQTPLGKVRFKIARLNGEVVNIMPEYEDCKRVAQSHNWPLKKVYLEVLKYLQK